MLGSDRKPDRIGLDALIEQLFLGKLLAGFFGQERLDLLRRRLAALGFQEFS